MDGILLLMKWEGGDEEEEVTLRSVVKSLRQGNEDYIIPKSNQPVSGRTTINSWPADLLK